jgi:alpha-D-ribose 1-methylphosphonate 5-triphosphate diphosphatase
VKLRRQIVKSLTKQKQTKIAIQGADVLTPQGWIEDAIVLIEDGRFTSISQAITPNGFTLVNAKGLQMLAGIVDLHGDAFERMISPRPGVSLPLPIAIGENDCSLLASGITTSFCSITDSYEPGLRSRDTARALIDLIWGAGKSILSCNHRIHLRHEQANTKGHEELCSWLETGRVQLLSINHHLPYLADRQKFTRQVKGFRGRLSLSEEEMIQLIDQVQEQQDIGLQQVEELVELAHTYRIPLASHDDDTEEKVLLSQRRRVAIAEFPANINLATKSRESGAAVLMSAPNLIRGGSHVGWMSVAEAARMEVLDCLCSDYHYPSLFYAPFKLHEMGLMSFKQAWELVSSRPADVVGLGKRKGKIAPDFDADFILITPEHPLTCAITSVYVAGKEVARYGRK